MTTNLDQAQLQAAFEYAMVCGYVDLFSPLFPKLYYLVADDRDWQPGELVSANLWLAQIAAFPCPLHLKEKRTDDLDCMKTCEWGWCKLRDVLYK